MNYYYDFKRNIEDVLVCFIIATTAQKSVQIIIYVIYYEGATLFAIYTIIMKYQKHVNINLLFCSMLKAYIIRQMCEPLLLQTIISLHKQDFRVQV